MPTRDKGATVPAKLLPRRALGRLLLGPMLLGQMLLGKMLLGPMLRGQGLLAPMLLGQGLIAAPAAARPPGELPIGGLLPDLTLRGLNGPDRRLAAFRGRPLVINVWASWCGPCIEEMASLERLAWHEGRVPFTLIGISTDDYPEPARRFLDRTRATISHYLDHDLQMETLLGAGTIPLTVLVGADGRLIARIRGSRDWDDEPSRQLLERAFRATAATARPVTQA